MRIPKFLSSLSRLRITIGIKLTATVAVGVVLVAGMMFNQHFSDAATAQQAELERSDQSATADLLRAGLALQRMQAGTQDIRLSLSEREVDTAVSAVRSSMDGVVNDLRVPLQQCAPIGNCEPLEKLVGLSKSFVAAAAELGTVKKEYGDIAKP